MVYAQILAMVVVSGRRIDKKLWVFFGLVLALVAWEQGRNANAADVISMANIISTMLCCSQKHRKQAPNISCSTLVANSHCLLQLTLSQISPAMQLRPSQSEIRHPNLTCPNSHRITGVCVNVHCTNTALFCQDSTCPLFELHEDCEHFTLRQFTRSLQKCQQYQLTLRSQMAKIYQALCGRFRAVVRREAGDGLPIADLDRHELKILNAMYIRGEFIDFSSLKAKQLNEKLKTYKTNTQKKVPLLVDNFREEMSIFQSQIRELQARCLQQLTSEFSGLSDQSRRKLQLQKMKNGEKDGKGKKEMVSEVEAHLQLFQSQQDQRLAGLKIQYERQIAKLEYQIKKQDARPQPIQAKASPEPLFPGKETGCQQGQSAPELTHQPARIQQNQKLSQYYVALDRLRSKNAVDDRLLEVYEKIADELRLTQYYQDSIYYYSKARELSCAIWKQGSKSEAYQTFWMASNYNEIQNYDKSLQLFQQALKMYERRAGSQQEVASTLSNMGSVYFNLGIFRQAMGSVYFNLGIFRQAIDYNEKAIKVLSRRAKKDSLSHLVVYTKNIGEGYFELGQYHQAEKYLGQCLRSLQSNQPEQLVLKGQCYQKLCEVSLAQQEYESAFRCINLYIANAKSSSGEIYPYEGKFLDFIREFVGAGTQESLKSQLLEIVREYKLHLQDMEGLLQDNPRFKQFEEPEQQSEEFEEQSEELEE